MWGATKSSGIDLSGKSAAQYFQVVRLRSRLRMFLMDSYQKLAYWTLVQYGLEFDIIFKVFYKYIQSW